MLCHQRRSGKTLWIVHNGSAAGNANADGRARDPATSTFADANSAAHVNSAQAWSGGTALNAQRESIPGPDAAPEPNDQAQG
jgi:hypothetical protein